MTYGVEFLVDENTGDLDITGNDFNICDNTSQSLRQRIDLRLNTWKGEWDYNTDFGLPVRQRILSGLLDKSQINAEYIAQINLEPDVTAVNNLQSEYDHATRRYRITRIDVYNDNTLYSLSLIGTEKPNFSYPTPLDAVEFNICSYKQDIISVSNDLYEFLNFDLPYSGDSTWWNLWE